MLKNITRITRNGKVICYVIYAMLAYTIRRVYFCYIVDHDIIASTILVSGSIHMLPYANLTAKIVQKQMYKTIGDVFY